MTSLRHRGWTFVLLASAVVAALTGNMAAAPQASADEGCPAGTAMNVVAHQDDDLIFQSPMLLSAIQDGLCMRTVYVTAGDANDSEDYWSAREDGVKAAYAHLAGVPDAWTVADAGIAGHPIAVATLDGAPRLSLAFMRLPDGYHDGRGGSNYGYQSLQKLYTGLISNISAVNGSSSYTLAGLQGTVLALMNSYQPDRISTLDFAGKYGDGDHSDHHTVAYLTHAAHQLYTKAHTITGYLGYPSKKRPSNVADAVLAAKTEAFLVYAQHDSKTCTTALDCSNNSVGAWLSRSYTVALPAAVPVASRDAANDEGSASAAGNVASAASVTASSENTASGQAAAKAVDGVIAGHPVDATREWATVGGKAGSYLNLAFPAPVTLNKVVLYDRPNTNDQITGATLTFSDGTTVPVPSLDNAGQATTITFPGRATTSLRLTVTTVSGTTRNVGLAELQAYPGTAATLPVPANVAATAAVTASSENTASGQAAAKAVDGVIAGHPVDATREWATVGGKAGSYLNLAFPAPVTLNKVVLYDRPNTNDQITGATLTFSDGTTVPVPALENTGQGTTITFPDRATTSLRLTVTTVSGTTRNVGLAELQAYGN